MTKTTTFNRRQFLKYSALGTAASFFPGLLHATAGQIGSSPTPGFNADVEIEFSARNAFVQILNSGSKTKVQKYYARLLKGPKDTLQQLPGNYLGPIINFVKGQKIRVFFDNRLTEPSIIHWHGLHVPQKSDGHPMYTIAPGERFVYEFEVLNRAGTSFYHSHSHELTAEQVYAGLAGLIKVSDDAETALDLPRGEYDLPLVIQDRSFDDNNQLQYVHGMMGKAMGFLGSTILVNGKPDAEFAVKSRAYRFRAVNGSNSRIYKLGWEDGTPLTAIGTDACLLEKPETRPYIMLAPGERVDLWLDFSGRPVGTNLVLYSLPFSGTMPSMYDKMHKGKAHGGDEKEDAMPGMKHGGMGMMSGGLAQGEKFPIARFKVTEKVSDSPKLPEKLVAFQRLTEADTDNADNPMPIAISGTPMAPTLNGKTFSMDQVMDIEKVKLGTIKKMKIYHDHGSPKQEHGSEKMAMDMSKDKGNGHEMGGGMGMMGGGMGDMSMMMGMAHPIHLHGQQFQILSRKTGGMTPEGYAGIKDGFINTGWKDTVLVMPGEEVEIVKPFQDFKGLFLYHCHNLEHEDLGMMRQFDIS